MNEAEKERLIKKDLVSIENRVRHAFNQGYEMGLKENKKQSGDAISRQAVLNAMYELCNTGETLKENPWRDNPHIDAVVEAIEELPLVTPQQRPGRWIQKEEADEAEPFIIWECSECSETQKRRTKHCPDCGCKMEVEE